MAEYIGLVQSCGDENDVMALLTPMFVQYMVASSWRKMHRRISQWSAQGFIYHLSRVKENALRAAIEPTVAAWRNDSRLSNRLITMEGYNPTFPSLLSACQNMQSMPWPSEPGQSKERSGLYNTATCFEFHQLLVSTLVDYGKALDQLDDAHTTYSNQPNGQNLAEMEKHIKKIWEYGELLWAIAYSRILEDHLGVLRKMGWLSLPVNEKTELKSFSTFTGFKRKPRLIANPPAVRNGGDVVVERCRDEAGQGGGDTVKGGEDGDAVEGGDCEDDDVRSIIDNVMLSDDKNLAKVYLDWIRLQVDRWQAPRKLTTFVRRVAEQHPIDLNVLAVRHPEPKTIHEAMEPWENTITDIYGKIRNKRKEPTAEDVICVLNDTITKMGSGGRDGVPNSIFRKFDPTRAKTGQFQATVHCEAVLAALSRFPSHAAGDDILKECLQVYSLISDIIMTFVNLTHCTGYRPKLNRRVKALLSGLLGAFQYLER